MTKLTTGKAAKRKLAVPSSAATKVTVAQRIFLLGAVQRGDGACTLPESMTEKAAQKLATALIDKGLVREVIAKAGAPIWRSDEEGRSFALVITKLGRAATSVGDDRQPASTANNAPSLSSNSDASPSQDLAASLSERSTPRQGAKLATVTALLSRKQARELKN
jgi:hypothetical protein